MCHAGIFWFNYAEMEIEPPPGMAFDNVSGFVWATAGAAISSGTCNPGGVDTDAIGDVDPFCIIGLTAEATLNQQAFARATASSCFIALGSHSISWWGAAHGEVQGKHCVPAGASGAAYGFTAWFTLSGSGTLVLPPPVCPTEQAGPPSNSRRVTATLICADDGSNVYTSSSALISYGQLTHTICGQGMEIAPGSYSLTTVTITIEDILDDVTGDGRFNQLDVDFLAGIVGTPAALDPAYSRHDRYSDPEDSTSWGVDDQDIMILQCFVDAGLSAGLLGDADGSGDLGCNDITVTVGQPFARESFPSAFYKVELDADLDGVNDGDDTEAVHTELRTVEPANFHFDDAINFFDQAAYNALFNAQDPRADIFPVGSPDGIFNFFDLFQFAHYQNNPACP
jgi:hypothetical protein